jgi:hypothetical protein
MQLNYDYFTTPECKILNPKVQTNPRYKNFTQMYYTVGDAEQFWVARNLTKGYGCESESSSLLEPQNNIFKNTETFTPFKGYENISEAQVENTFDYIFNKFKKGIFIKIRNGCLESFVPFSKAFYVNEWSDLIKINPKYLDSKDSQDSKSFEKFFKVQNDLSNEVNEKKYAFNVSKINLDPSFWYGNNCILRYENPINEGETNYAQIKSMFLELCSERKVPDMEFFVNRRDFPILTRNGTEPYNNIYGDDVPLKSYKFEKYLPILSMCTSDKYADVAIPTHEDWARIKSKEGVFFPQKCRNYNFKFNLNWESKKPIAVFRGSNTGCGFNVNNNPRLKLVKLGVEHPNMLDVGITNWNLRIRKNKDSEYLQIPEVKDLRLVGKLSPEKQSNYKYVINVDGHVSAFRLSLELSMGSCILMVKSSQNWKLWFSNMLEPYIHYVPVKSDLSDLVDQITWCRKNDEKCKKMAENSLDFYNKYLTKKGVLDNLQKTLFGLRDLMYGSKERVIPKDPLLFQTDVEQETLIYDNPIKEYGGGGLFPVNTGRNYGTLLGLEKFIKETVRPDRQITLAGVEINTLFQSKTTKVILYQIGSSYVIGKKTMDPMKKIEFIHEAFIGKYVINNLLKSCPNFVFTLGYRDEPHVSEPLYDIKENTVLQEYVYGPTLQEFLKNCSLKSYLEVILSLSCALIIAQKYYGFVHHDLKPWNVVVNILPEPIIVEYSLGNKDGKDVVYKIKTRYIPIMIDFGKSHVIYRNVHYGIVEPFKLNEYIDLFTMVISTVNELVLRLIQQKENFNHGEDLIYLTNFLSSTTITNFSQLKTFISKTKKFGNLNISDIKVEKGQSDTLFEEFFKYVAPLTKKYKISFGKDSSTLNTWSSNSRQIADMALALEIEDKVKSYLEVPRRIYKNVLPQSTNKFTVIMIAQRLFDGLIIPKMEFIEFASQYKINKKVVRDVLEEFNKMETFLMDFYTNILNKKKAEPFDLKINQEQYKNILGFDIKPSRSLFLESEDVQVKVIKETSNFPKQFPDYMNCRALILEVLRNRGPFKILDEDRKFYMDNFKIIFDDNFVSKVVDIETIRFFMK